MNIISYEASGCKGIWQITLRNLNELEKLQIIEMIEKANEVRKKYIKARK